MGGPGTDCHDPSGFDCNKAVVVRHETLFDTFRERIRDRREQARAIDLHDARILEAAQLLFIDHRRHEFLEHHRLLLSGKCRGLRGLDDFDLVER
jgi:hypothetical protein